jgi:hypothetical protein
MPTQLNSWRLVGVPASLLFCVVLVWGSSATFIIHGVGVDLGEAKAIEVKDSEGRNQYITQYQIKLERGQSFTLIAQGMVYPRGQAGGPFKPDSGQWLFDKQMFQAIPYDKKPYNKTIIVIHLKALRGGQSLIQFKGRILVPDHYEVDG